LFVQFGGNRTSGLVAYIDYNVAWFIGSCNCWIDEWEDCCELRLI